MSLKSIVRRLIASFLRIDSCKFMDSPVFVVGCCRSGKTTLANALQEHPNVLMVDREAPLVDYLGAVAACCGCSRVPQYTQYNVRLRPDVLKRVLRQLCYQSVFGSTYGLRYGPLNFGSKSSAYSCNRRVKVWGAQAFPSERAAEGLTWLFPHARFVYVFRNGLDVVCAMSRTGGTFQRDLPFGEKCAHWSRSVLKFDYLRRCATALPLRFEDLVSDPPGILLRMMSHLELPPDPGPERNASAMAVSYRRGPEPGPEAWSDEQKAVFKDVCSEAMETLGYSMPF